MQKNNKGFIHFRPPDREELVKYNTIAHRIAGVLVINDLGPSGTLPKDGKVRSDDVASPNALPNGNQSYTERWIHQNDSLIGSFFTHFHYPIFYIQDNGTINMIQQCLDTWNSDNDDGGKGKNKSLRGLQCHAELFQPNYGPDTVIPLKQCLKKTDRFITFQPSK